MRDPYEVLNVPRGAGRDDIRAAYRALAKRWHPDRFAEGPERDWASERMAEINSAYRRCLDGSALRSIGPELQTETLKEAERLMTAGCLSEARRKLLSVSTRTAEWNYLFGSILFLQRHYDKADIYLSIAVHQRPEEKRYSDRLEENRSAAAPSGLRSLLAGLRR